MGCDLALHPLKWENANFQQGDTLFYIVVTASILTHLVSCFVTFLFIVFPDKTKGRTGN